MVGAFVPEGDERFEFVRVLGCKILGFATVLVELVKLPRLFMAGDGFPSVPENGIVPFVTPPKSLVEVFLIFEEKWEKAFPGEGKGRGVLLETCEIEKSGEDVNDVGGGVSEFFFCRDSFGPVGDEGSGYASFMGPGFVFSEGGVGGRGPAWAEAEVGRGGAHGRGGFMAVPADHNFGACAVVREEEDEGVIEAIGLFKMRNDSSDFLIHAFDHSGVDGHLAGLEGLLGGGE